MTAGVATSALGARSTASSRSGDDVVRRGDAVLDYDIDAERTFAGIPVNREHLAKLRRTLVPLTKKLDEVYDILVEATATYGRVQGHLRGYGQNTSEYAEGIAEQLAELAAILAAQTAETLLVAQHHQAPVRPV
jgi:hypothetical protein